MVQLCKQDAETASEMRWRKMQNEGNIIDEINLMVIQNTINLENLDEIENADVYDNEIED